MHFRLMITHALLTIFTLTILCIAYLTDYFFGSATAAIIKPVIQREKLTLLSLSASLTSFSIVFACIYILRFILFVCLLEYGRAILTCREHQHAHVPFLHAYMVLRTPQLYMHCIFNVLKVSVISAETGNKNKQPRNMLA